MSRRFFAPLMEYRGTIIGVALLLVPLFGILALLRTAHLGGAWAALQASWAVPVLALPAILFALYEAAPAWLGPRSRVGLFVALVILLVASFPVTAVFGPAVAVLLLLDRYAERKLAHR